MSRAPIPPQLQSQTLTVLGSPMHYLTAGEGDPIVFLHGNPTSSYLWRNIIPYLEHHGRCIALDLIGMGRSGKPDIEYRLVDHIRYIDAFLDTLDLHNLIFVTHDWGVVLGLHYLKRFAHRVRAIVFMEGHLSPIARWGDFDDDARTMFTRLRTEGLGRAMAIEQNFFIETVLPAGTLRSLSQEEMNAYRAPYLDPAARTPLWRWPNEIPIEGSPSDVHQIVTTSRAFLTTCETPKLLLHATPGAVLGADAVAWCSANVPNLTALSLGDGLHFLPEDRPDEIGTAIAGWLDALR